MSFLAGTKIQMLAIRAAIANAEGMPRRATVVGGPDMLPQLYSAGAPGWIEQVCEAPVDGDTQSVINLPVNVEKWLGAKIGAVTLPAKAALKQLTDLSPDLIAAVRAKLGQNPDGSPMNTP